MGNVAATEAPAFEGLAVEAGALEPETLLAAFRAANIAVALTYLDEQAYAPEVVAARMRYDSSAELLGRELSVRANSRK